MRILTVLLVCLLLCGCGTKMLGDEARFRAVDGPAELTSNSPWGGTLTITIEEGGRLLAGPDMPDFYGTEPE